jgi:chemotaxis protein MotB
MRGKSAGSFSPSRADEGEGGDDSTRWLATYGDAITLLMAFFVMLYAMSSVDAAKFEAFVAGLADPFGNTAFTDGLLDAQPGIVGDAGDTVPGDVTSDFTSDIQQSLPVPQQDTTGEVQPDVAGQGSDDLAQLEGVQQAVMESLALAGLDDLADFRYDGRGLVMSLATDNVLFASGSTEISELGAELIAAVATPLRDFTNDVFVEGHTDDVPLSRGGYTNWNLSTDRAVAVVTLMAQQHGLGQERLGAAGYAEHRPLVPNDSNEHRATNRRVDILIVAEGSSR